MWALASVNRVLPYSRIKPNLSGPPTPMENRLPLPACPVTGPIYFYIQYYFLQVESRLLIKPRRLFRRFRYFTWGVNHDSMFVCMICVVVYYWNKQARQPKNRGLIQARHRFQTGCGGGHSSRLAKRYGSRHVFGRWPVRISPGGQAWQALFFMVSLSFFPQGNSRIVHQVGHDHFLPKAYIIHHSFRAV